MAFATKTVTRKINMLTDKMIKGALAKNQNIQLSDGNARGAGRLVLRVKEGKAEWYAQQWVNDRRRLSRIGNYPTLSLAQARLEFATNHQPKIARHEDIRSTPVTATVERLFSDYIQHLGDKGKRSKINAGRILRRVSAMLGKSRPANSITTEDIVNVIRPVYVSGCPSMAESMRAYVSAAFTWAIKSQRDYRSRTVDIYRLKANPAEYIPAEPKVPGDRWLSLDEMRAFWDWNDTETQEKNILVKLLMVTGQRTEEILRLHRDMINCNRMTIEWPKTKNGRAHVLPITDIMLQLIDQVKPNENGLLFPAEIFNDRPMSGETTRLTCLRYHKRTGARYFTPRDLRRTWKTLSGHAGLSKEDRDRLQNHASKDVSSVHYDRYDYLKEKRAAMERWCEWFSECVVKKKPPK
jgi:integrase